MSKVRFVDSSITISPGSGGTSHSAISASYALSASYADYAVSASHEIVKEVSSSYADTASYAVTASYALNGGGGGSGIFTETGSFYATTNNLQVTGSLKTTKQIETSGYVFIDHNGALVSNGTAALFLGTTNQGMDLVRLNDSSLVLGGVTQNYGWRIFGIKHGLNGSTYTTEIDNLIATGSMNVSGSIDISLKSGSAFTITEDDVDQENRLTFEYESGDPTLIIAGRSAESSLHLKYNLAGEGLKLTNQGLITRQVAGVEYGLRLSTNSFQPELGNQLDLGYYNDRWKTLYLYTGNKVSWGTTTNSDLASIRHTAGTNKLTITGSSDVTLDVKGDIIQTGSFLLSGSVDIAIPSGSAFTVTETDKDQKGRLDFFFDDGDPTLEIEGRSSVAKIVLSANDGETNNLKIQSDGQVYASDSVGPYTGSIKFKPDGIEAITTGTNSSPFIGSSTRPFYKYHLAQVGGQLLSQGSYSIQKFILNSSATGVQRSDGLYNQSSGIRIIVSGSAVSGGDGYLRNPNNVYFQIQDDSTGTGNNASVPFRVGKSGSLAINLNQSKGFGFTQYYTASAMVHVEAEPNYDLNLFQGNDVLGNNVFEVDRDGNLTLDAEISASGDLYARDGRFSRDGGAAEIEIIASEIAGGIVGTQTSDNLLFRRFNIPKFTISESRNVSHQNLDIEGNISASATITGITGSFQRVSFLPNLEEYIEYNDSVGGILIRTADEAEIIGTDQWEIYASAGASASINSDIELTPEASGQVIVNGNISASGYTSTEFLVGGWRRSTSAGIDDVEINVNGDLLVNNKLRLIGNEVRSSLGNIVFTTSGADIVAGGNVSGSSVSTASFGTYLGDGSQLTGIETDPFPYVGDAIITGSLLISGSGQAFRMDSDDVVLGHLAGQDLDNNVSYNVLIGREAGLNITTGDYNVHIGHQAKKTGTTGTYNVSVGSKALYGITGNYNVALGYQSGYTAATTGTGEYNTLLGAESGRNLTNGTGNVYVGYQAGFNGTNSTGNIIIGSGSLGTGTFNVSIDNQLRIGHGSNHIISGSLETGELLLKTVTLSGSLLNTGTVSLTSADSPYTITGTQQFVLIDPSGGDVTINMPDAATYPGREIRFKLTQAAGINTVTLQRQGADTIDGATTYTDLDIQYESISTVSDGSTGWFIF
tara:strand:+ start:297 stop:3773 length:3477 start_codon:yes stop_codon:yes gene_type:complete